MEEQQQTPDADFPVLSRTTPPDQLPHLGRVWRSGMLLACGPLGGLPAPVQSCPVVAIGSDADTAWPPPDLRAWEGVSHAGFDSALVQARVINVTDVNRRNRRNRCIRCNRGIRFGAGAGTRRQ